MNVSIWSQLKAKNIEFFDFVWIRAFLRKNRFAENSIIKNCGKCVNKNAIKSTSGFGWNSTTIRGPPKIYLKLAFRLTFLIVLVIRFVKLEMEALLGRDARDPVWALSNVQALYVMGFRPPGGVRLQNFGQKGEGVDCRFFGSSGSKRPKRRRRRRFRKFWRFSINLPNQYTKNTLKLHFKAISDGPICVSGHSKILKFPRGRSKSTFQRPDAQFDFENFHNYTKTS